MANIQGAAAFGCNASSRNRTRSRHEHPQHCKSSLQCCKVPKCHWETSCKGVATYAHCSVVVERVNTIITVQIVGYCKGF